MRCMDKPSKSYNSAGSVMAASDHDERKAPFHLGNAKLAGAGIYGDHLRWQGMHTDVLSSRIQLFCAATR